MYAAWLANPASVDESWQAYFSQLGDQGCPPPNWSRPGLEARQPSRRSQQRPDRCPHRPGPSRAAGKPGAKGDKTKPAAAPATDAEAPKHSIHAVQMIRAYRMIGHLEADLDPLASPRATRNPHWIPKTTSSKVRC